MGRYHPLNDFLFQKTFGERGGEKGLLTLLNAILKKPLKNIEIIENKKITADYLYSKESILYLRAIAQDNTKINIEIQLRNYRNMHMRTSFYWSKEFSKALKSGQDYNELPKIIVINIVEFNMMESSKFHNQFHLWEDAERNCLLTDLLEIHFIELPKFSKYAKDNRDLKGNALHRWLTFFDRKSEEKLIKEVVSRDKTIEDVNDRIEHLTQDEENRRHYFIRDRILSDQVSFYNDAIKIGEERGIERGIQSVVSMMLENKADDEYIQKMTGITFKELTKIKDNLFESKNQTRH